MKTSLIAFVVMCFLCTYVNVQGLFAQSTAQEIETLLNTDAVTYAQAARFVLDASNTMSTNNPQEAYNFAVQNNWLPGKTSADEAARLDIIALLLMRSFNIKGGLFYSLIGSPHYSYRELAYINVITGMVDPAMKVTGERLLFYTGRILSLKEESN